jgi:hypothetical protein
LPGGLCFSHDLPAAAFASPLESNKCDSSICKASAIAIRALTGKTSRLCSAALRLVEWMDTNLDSATPVKPFPRRIFPSLVNMAHALLSQNVLIKILRAWTVLVKAREDRRFRSGWNTYGTQKEKGLSRNWLRP